MNPFVNQTLWLQNSTSSNVSLHLHQLRSPASPGFRRGMLLMPVNVPAGGHYDVCKGLGVSYDEAVKIVDASPEYHLHNKKGRIYKLPQPPIPQPVAAPVLPTSEPESPFAADPAAQLGPRDDEPAAADVTVPEDAETTAAAGVPQGEFLVPGPETAVPLSEPSMEWSEDQLRAYAEKKGIDVTKLKSKTAVLRAIRK